MSQEMDLTARMLHLRQIPVAALLPPPVLRKIAGALRPRTFDDGTTVLRQGAPLDAMYLLTDGTLHLEKDGQPFSDLVAPQTVGFLPIIARLDTPYDATAKGEARALELDTDTLLEIFDDHFELTAATLRYIAERLYFELRELPEGLLGIPPAEVGPVPAHATDLVERILLTRHISGFATANVNALAVLARQVVEARPAAGARLWAEGDPSGRVLFLVAGTIQCETSDGRRFTYGPGTGVGGLEALAERPRWYTATAATEVVGFWGETADLVDLFEYQPRMAMDFIAMLARAQLGLLARKSKLGQDPLAGARDVSRLGAVKVGA